MSGLVLDICWMSFFAGGWVDGVSHCIASSLYSRSGFVEII